MSVTISPSKESVTITITREYLIRFVEKAKSSPDLHSTHCPHFTSWGGECNCWVSQARKALEGGKA